MIKIISACSLLLLIFFASALLQTNFFPYFNIIGGVPQLVFSAFFVVIFFEDHGQKNQSPWYMVSLFSLLVCGFLLDIISGLPFGISFAALLLVYLLNAFGNYFFKEQQSQYLAFYFTALYVICFVVFEVIVYVSLKIIGNPISLGMVEVVSCLYSLPFAWIGFMIYQGIVASTNKSNQLKLL